ncbi:hypothetical protein ACOMHN_019593 [Nucella lapillus]
MLPAGRSALRYKDVCKRDFKAGGIAAANFEALAADRSSWQLATRSAIKTAEQRREEKWEKKKSTPESRVGALGRHRLHMQQLQQDLLFKDRAPQPQPALQFHHRLTSMAQSPLSFETD